MWSLLLSGHIGPDRAFHQTQHYFPLLFLSEGNLIKLFTEITKWVTTDTFMKRLKSLFSICKLINLRISETDRQYTTVGPRLLRPQLS